MPKRILILGGSGFVGNALTSCLLRDGNQVTLLNRGNNRIKGCNQLIADRNSEADMKNCSSDIDIFDVLIDTSSYNIDQTERAWRYFSDKTNMWIHLSSASVYKEKGDSFEFIETDSIGGAKIWGKYGEEKSQIDSFLIKKSGGKSIVILRPPYLYGPQNDNERETFIWSRALNNCPILVPGDGNTLIQFLHVNDLAICILKCIKDAPLMSVVYNVASAELISLKQWVNLLIGICQLENSNVNLVNGYAGENSARQYFPFRDYPCCLNIKSIETDLDWKAVYTLNDGFRQTFDSYTIEYLRRISPNISDIEGNIYEKLQKRTQ